ncbi:hypothetical protein DAPK24_020300 [Pichia kluyveri]|uniref:GST C-terminal domain-containing protein n=1 Tax=Pichia kluyveri TaxID=36015 RepID=A0AAV5R2H6_PICKL|nr:hypothetical protein DAPK24_020300 [Pichia kluyveri]
MTWATLYMEPNSGRSNWISDLGKYVGLDIESVDVKTVDNYKELFQLGKTPALITSDGFKLTEAVVIYVYIINSSSKPEFLGKNLKEKATNMKWLSFFNSDFIFAFIQAFFGTTDNDKSSGMEKIYNYTEYFNNELKEKKTKYLISDEILVADIVAYKIFHQFSIFGLSYDKYNKIAPYLESLKNHPILAPK